MRDQKFVYYENFDTELNFEFEISCQDDCVLLNETHIFKIEAKELISIESYFPSKQHRKLTYSTGTFNAVLGSKQGSGSSPQTYSFSFDPSYIVS